MYVIHIVPVVVLPIAQLHTCLFVGYCSYIAVTHTRFCPFPTCTPTLLPSQFGCWWTPHIWLLCRPHTPCTTWLVTLYWLYTVGTAVVVGSVGWFPLVHVDCYLDYVVVIPLHMQFLVTHPYICHTFGCTVGWLRFAFAFGFQFGFGQNNFEHSAPGFCGPMQVHRPRPAPSGCHFRTW